MPFLARLLSIALSLPPPYYLPGREPETPAARSARIETIVRAAVAESEEAEAWPGSTEDLALLLLSVTWFESRRWAVEVHDGRARGDRGASVCLAQVWSRDASLAGTSMEATRNCMRKAAEILLRHAERCQVRRIDEYQVARLLGAYGTGRTCGALSWAGRRAAFWTTLKRKSEGTAELPVTRLGHTG